MKLEVNLKQNPYDIIIEKGALKGVGQWVKSLWEPQKIALITDNHVGGLYAEKVKLSLENEGFEVVVFNFLEGEASKNLKTVNKAYEFLIKNGMTRSDGIVALGGGVVGDLAGFVASTYMRNSFRSSSNQSNCPSRFIYWWKDRCEYSFCQKYRRNFCSA